MAHTSECGKWDSLKQFMRYSVNCPSPEFKRSSTSSCLIVSGRMLKRSSTSKTPYKKCICIVTQDSKRKPRWLIRYRLSHIRIKTATVGFLINPISVATVWLLSAITTLTTLHKTASTKNWRQEGRSSSPSFFWGIKRTVEARILLGRLLFCLISSTLISTRSSIKSAMFVCF